MILILNWYFYIIKKLYFLYLYKNIKKLNKWKINKKLLLLIHFLNFIINIVGNKKLISNKISSYIAKNFKIFILDLSFIINKIFVF